MPTGLIQGQCAAVVIEKYCGVRPADCAELEQEIGSGCETAAKRVAPRLGGTVGHGYVQGGAPCCSTRGAWTSPGPWPISLSCPSFPLVTLLIMALSIFTDPVVMQEKLADTLVYFFPASRELLQNAMIRLFSGSLALGLIVLAGIVVSANGLFMAANRSVNRVFGIETRKPVGTMTTEVVIGTVLLVMFMFSVGFTILFRFATSVGGTSAFLVFSSRAVSEALSAGLTAMMFGVMYYRLPNTRVMWKDAAFGGLIAVVLFEAGKHLFFWFTNMASERSAVYGPVASVVILLMWAYIVGLIFLYRRGTDEVYGRTPAQGASGRRPSSANCSGG